MALSTALTTGYIPQQYGLRVSVLSTDPTFGLEVQHATASNAPTSKWISQRLPAYAGIVGSFVVPLAHTTQLRYVRARTWKAGYTDSAFTTVVSGRPQLLSQLLPLHLIGAIQAGVSTPHNNQGSILPSPGPNTLLSYASNGASGSAMWISFTWGTAIPIQLPDGTQIAPGNSNNLPSPTFTLSQVAGGVLAARTRFVRVALVKDNNLYLGNVNTETSLAVNLNNLLVVNSPAAVAGYDGWTPLVGALTNTEFVQGGSGALPVIAFGTNWTEPVGGATVSGTVLTQWAANWAGAITITGLAASTQYFLYPAWDRTSAGIATVRLCTGTTGAAALSIFTSRNTAAAALAASQQQGDGFIGLSGFAPVTVTTPAINTAGSGNPSIAPLQQGRWV